MVIKNINLKLYYLICLLIVYMFISNMMSVYGAGLPFHRLIIFLIFFLTFFGLLNIFVMKKTADKKILNLCLSIFILIGIVTFLFLINLNLYFDYSFLQFVNSVMWIMLLLFSYLISIDNPESVKYLKRMVYVLPIFLLCFIKIKAYSNNTGIPLIVSIYYLVFLIPILFTYDNKVIKIIGTSIVMYALLLSQKRTGLLSVSCFFFSYYFLSSSLKNRSIKNSIKTLLLFGLIVIVLYFSISFILKYYNIEIFDKLMRLKEDGGSGRIDTWKIVIYKLKKSSLLNLFFGHGYNSFYYQSSLYLSTHNDYLEILYDYGVIGFVLYAKLLYILLKKGIMMFKEKNKYSPSFISSIVLVLIFSFSSHLIIYPNYFFYMCLFWGYCLAIDLREVKNEKS